MKKSGFILSAILCILITMNSCYLANGQQTAGEYQINEQESIKYLIYLPEEYVDGGESMPLLLFLHGGGESGTDIEKVKKHGPPMLIEKGKDFPFIVLSPQNKHVKKYWDEQAVIALLDHMIETQNIDQSRIYLSGMSRGGYGAWQLAIQYPEKFAALIAICGVAPSPYAGWIDKNMPIWVFHGEDDPVIPISESERMVKALENKGYQVKFTRYPNTGHDSWTETYNNEMIYEWMLNQRR